MRARQQDDDFLLFLAADFAPPRNVGVVLFQRFGKDVAAGAHINGVGSYTPAMQEVDAETVRRALVVVDEREAAWEEAGDLIRPLQDGLITEAHIHAELGEIVAGLKPGRSSPEQITFFKSVGVAVQDAISGRIALANAITHNLGTEANL